MRPNFGLDETELRPNSVVSTSEFGVWTPVISRHKKAEYAKPWPSGVSPTTTEALADGRPSRVVSPTFGSLAVPRQSTGLRRRVPYGHRWERQAFHAFHRFGNRGSAIRWDLGHFDYCRPVVSRYRGMELLAEWASQVAGCPARPNRAIYCQRSRGGVANQSENGSAGAAGGCQNRSQADSTCCVASTG